MNQLGITLATAALQVTLAALPAAVLVALAGRRSPRTAAGLAAAALGLCLVLTAAAFGPPPPWRGWLGTQKAPTAPAVVAVDAPPAEAAESSSWGIPLGQLLNLLPAAQGTEAPEPIEWSGWSWLAAAVVAGTAVAGLRLVLALRAVSVCRRRSRPVHDAAMLRLLDEVRAAVGCRGAVELRTCAAVGTAATVGWRRPAVLLAEDWPSWSPDELRAVLAHELAHVRRRDYPTALFASACRALHFYHPLVNWLAGRLRLHQELAADALAAPAAGGRSAYLVALARMALRQERFCAAGAARPFLSDRGSLLRRIAMLRVTDDGRPLSGAARWGMAGLLVAAALGASAVRGTAQAPERVTTEAVAELPPFDLTFVPPKADGVVLIRPAALLARPEMKPVVERWNRALTAGFRELGFGPDFTVPLEAIEQIVGPFELKTLTEEERKQHPNGERHAVMMGMTVIRMVPGFDWRAKLKALPSAWPLVEVEGVIECRSNLFGPMPAKIRLADPRTLVFTIFDHSPDARAENVARWGAAGRAVERTGMALLLDNRSGRWTESLKDDKTASQVAAVLGTPTHLAFGLKWGECVGVTCAAEWADEPADADVTRGAETVCKLLGAALHLGKPTDPAEQVMHGLTGELLRSAKVRRDGKLVVADATASVRWVDVLKAIPVDEESSKKSKVEGKEVKP